MSNTGEVVFGVCDGCGDECIAPPTKVADVESIRWTNKPGKAQVDYKGYCLKVKCVDAAVRAQRQLIKAHGITIAGVELPAAPVSKTTRRKKKK